MSYRTFALTIRPRGGYSGDDLNTIHNWLTAKTQAYFIATEMQDDKRHLHIGFQMDKDWKMSNIRLTIKRLFEKTWEADCLKHGLITKVWYSMDWYEEYSQKEGEEAIIHENLPEDWQPAFPPEDDKQLKRPVSIWFAERLKEWNEETDNPNPSIRHVKEFVMRKILDFKIEAIADPKIFGQKCDLLHRFITSDHSFPEPEEYGVCSTCKKRRHVSDFCN